MYTDSDYTNSLPWLHVVRCLCLILMLMLLGGCAPKYVRGYSGPELPANEVAVIKGDRHEALLAPDWVVIKKVDDVELGSIWKGWPSTVHLKG